MGYVHADITLVNAADLVLCKNGFIKEQEIRQTSLTAMVDTGVATLIINEALRQQLGIDIDDECSASLAGGSKHTYHNTEPIIILWKNRKAVCHAIVVPNADEVLLGVIPLEAMDLLVNPLEQELVGAHGDEIIYRIK